MQLVFNVNRELRAQTEILSFFQGDWKLAGLGLTIPLTKPDGSPSRWEFPTFDGRVPAYTQRSFDYIGTVTHIMITVLEIFSQIRIAPEYALDEVLDPASDMYSLGCLMYAVHCKGSPPFKNHGSLGAVRDNAGKPLAGLDRLDPDLRGEFQRSIASLTDSGVSRGLEGSHNKAFPNPPFADHTAFTCLLLLPPDINA